MAEIQKEGWWILSNGDIVKINESHFRWLFNHQDKFSKETINFLNSVQRDEFPEDEPDSVDLNAQLDVINKALENGHIRILKGGNTSFSVTIKNPSREAMSSLQEFMKRDPSKRVFFDIGMMDDTDSNIKDAPTGQDIIDLRTTPKALINLAKGNLNSQTLRMHRDSKDKTNPYKKYLNEEINFEDLLVEALPEKYWVLPDGEVKNLGNIKAHARYAELNPEELGISDDATHPGSQALMSGAVRLSVTGQTAFIMISDSITRDAFKAVQEFVSGLQEVEVEHIEAEEATFSANQFAQFRNKKALINRVRSGGSSVLRRHRG